MDVLKKDYEVRESPLGKEICFAFLGGVIPWSGGVYGGHHLNDDRPRPGLRGGGEGHQRGSRRGREQVTRRMSERLDQLHHQVLAAGHLLLQTHPGEDGLQGGQILLSEAEVHLAGV